MPPFHQAPFLAGADRKEWVEMNLKIQQDISGEAQAPVLLAGWPGMGQVGIGAIRYIRRKLDSELFAEIDMEEHFTPEAVVVEDSLIRLPDSPSQVFYYARNPELVIFESEAQVGGTDGTMLVGKILDLAIELRVETIYTGAAFASPISHKEPVRVLGVANQKDLRDLLFTHGVEKMAEGQVAGLNGLLLGFAGLRGMGGACLLATMPQYAISVPNPKASREIVRVLERILDFRVDMTELDRTLEEAEKTMAEMEGNIDHQGSEE